MPADVRVDRQFKRQGRLEFNLVLFAFLCVIRRTEIPLLPNDILPGSCSRREPSQHELLRPGKFLFFEDQSNDAYCLRTIEHQANGLGVRRTCPPTPLSVARQCSFDWIAFSFGRYFNRSHLL